MRIARATRERADVSIGAGPRGAIAIIRAARAHALLAGREFTIPDDVDEQIHVDLLLMSPAGLVVLDVRRIEGTVFAGENLDGWTALHGRGRTVVANPLPGLRARLHALRALVPDIPVKGYVLVLGEASFSGPAPERVVTPVQLESVLPARTGAPSEALKAAWEAVEAAARRLSPGAKLR